MNKTELVKKIAEKADVTAVLRMQLLLEIKFSFLDSVHSLLRNVPLVRV